MTRETSDASHEGFPLAGALHGAEPPGAPNTRNLGDNWQGKPCWQTATFWPVDTGGGVDPLPDGGAPPPAHERHADPRP